MALVDETVNRFIEAVASSAPAPGGGTVAALAGAAAGALASMVSRLTADNPRYAAASEEAREILAEAQIHLRALLRDVDRDSEAFLRVMNAYRLPKATEGDRLARSEAIQAALKEAACLPFRVATDCQGVLELAIRLLEQGNDRTASDAVVAGLMAHAGIHSALYNVRINLASLADRTFAETMREEVRDLAYRADARHVLLRDLADRLIP